MDNRIHVLNGDSTKEIFNKTSLNGSVVVWREMCCEGQLAPIVDSDEFWQKRYVYFEEECDVSKLEYFDTTIKELLKLTEIQKGSEVVLWFEYDLFCQINMLAACALLLQNFRKDISYYLVCVGYRKGSEKLLSLSDYSTEDYKDLYEQKLKITRNDLEYAKSCWEVYVRGDKHEIASFNFGKSSKFRYLKKAMNQHLDRFPDAHGLNRIDYKILEMIDENAQTLSELVRSLLHWQAAHALYGFGDMQYFSYIKRLQNFYYRKNDLYFLKDLGKTLIEKS